ncbi:MAG: 4Fe-4S dicluster domain-containing protein [Candidatus Heimdallarchaeota archaeon]|nr:4Fe-4S dicluster domain-containing protein [Candidatus Heimdallarchaeota archaeon]
MKRNIKSLKEINQRIKEGNAVVITADEMPTIVAALGPEEAAEKVDVVTTGTFGAMCSSGVWLNFGHADPPIKMAEVWLNGVKAYSGVAAVDAYLGATEPSLTRGREYGGGHVIEELLRGKAIHLLAKSTGTDCYPRKDLSTEITLSELNQAIMSNPRNGYERYNVATNSSDKILQTYMGKLLPNYGNATFSGAGELSPIINDPTFNTIGVGTRIFFGGAHGYIIGNGTQHDPRAGFSTLMLQGNLKEMSPDFIRGATISGYGCTLFVGIGVPIPILNTAIAQSTAICDREIDTCVIDYGVPSRNRPTITQTTYAELKTGTIEINGEEVKTAPLSSFVMAKRIATVLKERIKAGRFLLSKAVQLLPRKGENNGLKVERKTEKEKQFTKVKPSSQKQFVWKDDYRCIHCGLCVIYCPLEVFRKDGEGRVSLDASKCIQCRECEDICPLGAITLLPGGKNN